MEDKSASSFLGCGWKFPPAVNAVTGRIELSKAEEDIAEAVRIILFTGIGERVMRPGFGCGIRRYAFSDMSAIDIRGMEQELLEALIKFEPRITNPQINVRKKLAGEGVLEIGINYVVRATNNPYNLVFPYYLNEGG